MKELFIFIRQYTVWLHHTVLEYHWVYIDLWSFVHFWSGAVVFSLLSTLNWKNRWRWLLFFLTIFEVVEAFLFIGLLKMFRPEKIPDIFMDILIGMAGGYVMHWLFEKKNMNTKSREITVMLISSLTISFLWTGFYDSNFNPEAIKRMGFNLRAFILWATSGTAILSIYYFLKKWLSKATYSLWLVYALYFAVLIGIHVMPLRNQLPIAEQSIEIAGIKVNKLLFWFYLITPATLVLLNKWLKHITSQQAIYLSKNETQP